MKERQLIKDAQIIRIVDYFKTKYKNKVLIKDFWDADLCAIGICDNGKKYLVYISSFGLPVDKFNIVLESMTEIEGKSKVIAEYNNIGLHKLEELLKIHLRI